MKPLFTVHAGEFVAGEYIEKNFHNVHVWLPAKDTGVDLLISDAENKNAVSLQVKSSRDFSGPGDKEWDKSLRALGWWTLNRQKIKHSRADYWVFVLVGSERRSTNFLIIKPRELLERLDTIHDKPNTIRIYLCVMKNGRCWETRDLNAPDRESIAKGTFKNTERDFTPYLNKWDPIKKALKLLPPDAPTSAAPVKSATL